MADETQIIDGSFKGVPIAIDSGSVSGGRKTAIKTFPNRDTQSVEDLGLRPRSYSLEIIISQRLQETYFDYRDRLLAALETKGAGELIHPLYGRIENVVATSYSINESFGKFGDTVVSVTFEVNNTTGIPSASDAVATQIESANDTVQSAAKQDIEENFEVTSSFLGNFQAAVDKVNNFIDQAKDATSFIGEAADTLNEVSAEIGELAANVNSLVTDPLALADSISNLFQSVNGLYASTTATFETFVGFFGFGDDDDSFALTTAGRVERKSNNNALTGSINSASLGYAYLAASQIDYGNTREIDEVAARLDEQYESVLTGGGSQESKDAITDMRIKVIEALEQARVNASQIITVETLPTSARLLAFNYYGNDKRGDEIVDLNSVDDVSFVEGEVEVLTE